MSEPRLDAMGNPLFEPKDLDVLPDSTFALFPKCPWCYEYMRDANELFDGGKDVSETECGWCEKPILITQVISVDYRTEARRA